MVRSKLLIPAALAAALATGAASAQTAQVTSGYSPDPAIAVAQARLAYTEADLATAAGAQAMLSRIEAAAQAVCRTAVQGAADCRAEAVRGAVARLDNPQVRELASHRPAEHAER